MGAQSSNNWSRSCVMKSELLSRRYTSLALQYSILFVALIHVASLGADQLSLGTTLPPSSAMVDFNFWWISGHRVEGSVSGSESESESESEAVGGGENTAVCIGGGEIDVGFIFVWGEDDAVGAEVGEEGSGEGDKTGFGGY